MDASLVSQLRDKIRSSLSCGDSVWRVEQITEFSSSVLVKDPSTGLTTYSGQQFEPTTAEVLIKFKSEFADRKIYVNDQGVLEIRKLVQQVLGASNGDGDGGVQWLKDQRTDTPYQLIAFSTSGKALYFLLSWEDVCHGCGMG